MADTKVDQDMLPAVLPLLIKTDDGSFATDQRTMHFLQQHTGKIAIVALAGGYRTGKSSFLNSILPGVDSKGTPGFTVGDTVNACTTGLMLHTTPLAITEDGCTIFVVDTEGIGALDANSTHDVRIFSLALLLSSSLIYNSMGAINEQNMQLLSVVTRVCKEIHVSTTDQRPPSFPHFIWMLRDFELDLETPDGVPITANTYLERSLDPEMTQAEAVGEGRKEVRAAIRALFKSRECKPIPMPTKADLDNKAQTRYTKPSPYRRAINDLREHLIQTVAPIQAAGIALNGAMYCKLVGHFADKVCDPNVCPNMKDSYTLLAELNVAEAKAAATAHFQAGADGLAAAAAGGGDVEKQFADLVDASILHFESKTMSCTPVHLLNDARASLRAEMRSVGAAALRSARARDIVVFWDSVMVKPANGAASVPIEGLAQRVREWEQQNDCASNVELRLQFHSTGLQTLLPVACRGYEAQQRLHKMELQEKEFALASSSTENDTLRAEIERLRAQLLVAMEPPAELQPAVAAAAGEELDASSDTSDASDTSDTGTPIHSATDGGDVVAGQFADKAEEYQRLLELYQQLAQDYERVESALGDRDAKMGEMESALDADKSATETQQIRFEQLAARLRDEIERTKSLEETCQKCELQLQEARELVARMGEQARESATQMHQYNDERWERVQNDWSKSVDKMLEQYLVCERQNLEKQMQNAQATGEARNKTAVAQAEAERFKRKAEALTTEAKKARTMGTDAKLDLVRAKAVAASQEEQIEKLSKALRDCGREKMALSAQVGDLSAQVLGMGGSLR